MATDIGKIFEGELQKVFARLRESHLLGWHKLSDTSAARGVVVGAQPSDYILTMPPTSVPMLGAPELSSQRMLFLEAKASESKPALTRAAMKPAQRGAIMFHRQLLKIPYLVIFYAAGSGELQVWDGLAMDGTGTLDKKFLLARCERAGSGVKLNLDRVSDFFVQQFNLPEKSVTLATYQHIR